MANADIGANNALWIGIEPTYGTPSDPTAVSPGTGVWMPFLDESLIYTETKYYSKQIRQQAMASSVVAAPYHVEGTIHFEVDANYLPYLLYASRHSVSKTGPVSTLYTYTATPTSAGATYPGGTAKGISILIVRNAVGFLYSGCVITDWQFVVNAGVLECTATIIGLAETDPHAAASPTFVAPDLFGADAHTVYVDVAGLTPSFATPSNMFSGFTFGINHNGSAQNRINPNRAATFIQYGETEPMVTTELDFLDKTAYNAFKAAASNLQAIKLESNKPGGTGSTFAGATDSAVRLTMYNGAYDTYTVDTKGLADIISAAVTIKGLSIAGGSGYKIECKSTVNIT